MSKQQIESSEEEKQDVVGRWGIPLREARLARGMSIEEISKILHLETKLIEAVESEDLERLPSASFVRGYLRSYSKLLEVDAEPIVRAYGLVCGSDPSVITKVARVKAVSSKDSGPRYATWLVVAVLAISVVIWWRAEVLLPSVVKNNVIETVLETEPVDPLVFDVIPPLDSEDVVVTMPEALLEAEVMSSAPETESEPEPEPEPVLSTLVLTFSDDSWVEIDDGQGKRLYMDMAKSGQSKTVAGEPPFKVLFGNAAAVTLEYNGEIYDHAKHSSKGIARFTLGE